MTDQAAAEDAAVAALVAGRRILIAHGLLGEVAGAMSRIGFDYMVAQREWLTGLGAVVEVVKLPTARSVDDNAAVLAAHLLGGAPALIIGHSKGGLDALAALLRPEVAAHCRGLLALQAPFLGSPVADAICRAWLLPKVVDAALRMLRLGNGAGISDLTSAARASWMARHAEAVAALLRQVPVVCAGATLTAPAIGSERNFLPVMRWMLKRGAGPNDGLVPLASSMLPGAPHVVFKGGHRALVAIGSGRDPIGALRQLLPMVLR